MRQIIESLLRRPWFAHLLAANTRFGARLGTQFAGSVTYFSVLSMIPALMFAVSALGLTFTVLRPELLPEVQRILHDQLGTAGAAKDINDFVSDTFANWPSIALTALLAAAYSGSNWVKNLKHAVRAMWEEDFSEAARTGNFFKEVLKNLVIFFGLLLSVAVAVAVTSAGQAFPKEIIAWLGLGSVPGITVLLRLVGVAVSLVASWLLFAFLFLVLPRERTGTGTWIRATVAGAVLVTILQQGAGLLVSLLRTNKSAGVFGPIIIVMIVFNLLATLILMLAAWVGTAESWEKERAQHDAERALAAAPEKSLPIAEPVTGGGPPPVRAGAWAGKLDADALRSAGFEPPTVEVGDEAVSRDVAARGVRVGLGLGYGVGAATGAGLGALLAAALSRLDRH